MGEWNTNSDIDCGDEFCGLPTQDILLSHVVVHPGYERQTFKDNIALIVLRSTINYTGKNFCKNNPKFFYIQLNKINGIAFVFILLSFLHCNNTQHPWELNTPLI